MEMGQSGWIIEIKWGGGIRRDGGGGQESGHGGTCWQVKDIAQSLENNEDIEDFYTPG